MTNLEKILQLSKSKGYKSLYDECKAFRECSECSLKQVLGLKSCHAAMVVELINKEYKEPRKLNKREHGYLEYVENGFITRDESGSLIMSKNMPTKEDTEWIPHDCNFEIIDRNLFKFITWEDEEPYSVEEMIKWEVEE